MGTNYYIEEKPPRKECGRHFEQKHIGKSSAGWCFALHVYPEDEINTLADWIIFWKDKIIVNEYNEVISEKEMLAIITKRKADTWCKKPFMYNSWDEFHKLNQSEKGPNNLIRHKIDGIHCIGYGDGTWDYIIGDFC